MSLPGSPMGQAELLAAEGKGQRAVQRGNWGPLTAQEQAVHTGRLLAIHSAVAVRLGLESLGQDIHSPGVVARALVHVGQNAHGPNAGPSGLVQGKALVEGVQRLIHMANLHASAAGVLQLAAAA